MCFLFVTFTYPFQKNNNESKMKKLAGISVIGLPEKKKRTQEKVIAIDEAKASFLLYTIEINR